MRFVLPVLLVAGFVSAAAGFRFFPEKKKLCDRKCFPGQPCWPSDQTFAEFLYTLAGGVFSPSDPEYAQRNTMKNDRVKREPALIVFAKNQNDVIKSIRFARKHNIRVSVMSSGHSYVGRSTHDGSLLINMSNMTKIDVRTDLTTRSPGGEETVESGNAWARVYEEVDKHGRVVVGGSAHTVAMGGYTQGGGHSPLSRSLGLAVDNLLEATIVTADGHLATVSADGTFYHDTMERTTDDDLFWAIRGGGGGTWGVVINFTFKMHIPPSGFVSFVSFYPMVTGETTPGIASLTSIVEKMKQLPREWGGYIVTSTGPQDNQPPSVDGRITMVLLHYGPWSAQVVQDMQPFVNDPNSVFSTFINRTSFWDYESGVSDPDVSELRTYIVNSFIQPDVSARDLSNMVVEEMYAGVINGSGTGCTFTLIGGQMNDVDPRLTPINPSFRTGLFAASCGRIWVSPISDERQLSNVYRFNKRMLQLGDGSYFNEAAQDLTEWKTDFWGKGGNYEMLLGIKRKWDPDNFFCCHNCVGSDLEEPFSWFPSSSSQSTTTSLLVNCFPTILAFCHLQHNFLG